MQKALPPEKKLKKAEVTSRQGDIPQVIHVVLIQHDRHSVQAVWAHIFSYLGLARLTGPGCVRRWKCVVRNHSAAWVHEMPWKALERAAHEKLSINLLRRIPGAILPLPPPPPIKRW